MKLIIDISKEEYNKICNYDGMNVTRMMSTIQNGTPLPKGHGRLIDADKLDTSCGIRTVDCPENCDKCSDCVVKYEDIHNAKTIVEADMENDND